ncbi:MAG: hypothetical protein R3F49_04125 [Planctomycetota bacterium]
MSASPEPLAPETSAGARAGVPGAAPARGCLGCFVSSGLGCGAFLFGAVLAVALFAPQLLGGWGARLAEGLLRDRVDALITVGGAELTWREDLRLRDVVVADITGSTMLRGTLRVPSLAKLVSGDEAGLMRVRVKLQEARLALDEAGVLDLCRAFRWDAARAASERVEPLTELWRRLADVGRGRHAPFQLEVDAHPVSLRDLRRPGAGPIELTDLLFEVGRTTRSGPAELHLSCGVFIGVAAAAASAQGERGEAAAPAAVGSLQVRASIAAPELDRPGACEAHIVARGLQAPVLALLLEQLGVEGLERAELEGLVGAGLDLTFDAALDESGAGAVALALDCDSSRLRFTGAVADGVLRLTRDHAGRDTASAASDDVDWLVPTSLVERLLRPLLPDAWRIDVSAGAADLGGPEVLRVRARLEAVTCETGLAAGWAPRLKVRGIDAEVASTADLAVVDAAQLSGATFHINDPVTYVRWGADAAAGSAAGSVSSVWRSASGRPGRVEFKRASATYDVDLPELPVALLQVGVDMPLDGAALLGEAVRLQVSGLRADLPPGARQSVEFALFAADNRAPVRGHFSDLVARADSDRPQSIMLRADDDTLQRVLGPVLPWLQGFQAPRGGALVVSFERLSIPLDGGALRPVGQLEFEVPQLRVLVAPKIAALFGFDEDEPHWSVWSPRRFKIDLQQELVRYPAIELPLGGEAFQFRDSSFDRGTRILALQGGEVPARLVPRELTGRPEIDRLLIDSELPVAVSINGSINAPKLTADPKSMQDNFSQNVQRAFDGVAPVVREVGERLERMLEVQPSERPEAGVPPERPAEPPTRRAAPGGS